VIRTLLVLLCVAVVVLALLGMRRGWRNRARRQSGLPPLPAVPAELGGPSLRLTGLYVGTTVADRWQDRVVHQGLGTRAAAVATLHRAGVLIDRAGAAPVFLPRDALHGARLAPGLAGKVTGAGGLLVIRWQLGGAALDTGLRGDDKDDYPAWVHAINGKVST